MTTGPPTDHHPTPQTPQSPSSHCATPTPATTTFELGRRKVDPTHMKTHNTPIRPPNSTKPPPIASLRDSDQTPTNIYPDLWSPENRTVAGDSHNSVTGHPFHLRPTPIDSTPYSEQATTKRGFKLFTGNSFSGQLTGFLLKPYLRNPLPFLSA